jgi:hypothetical protein
MRLASDLGTKKNLLEGGQVLAGMQKAKEEPGSAPPPTPVSSEKQGQWKD